jgi:hypothetical protein
MNELIPFTGNTFPTLIDAAAARDRFLNFFIGKIRNLNTRRVYAKAAEEFLAYRSLVGAPSITAALPIHVATYEVRARLGRAHLAQLLHRLINTHLRQPKIDHGVKITAQIQHFDGRIRNPCRPFLLPIAYLFFVVTNA